jgi:threonyl-tRNA synthetase
MPERFELEYTDVDGAKKRPVMIHRALFGSMERFIGIMLEHYGGSMPLWLSPTQVRVLPISDKFMDYAKQVFDACKSAGLRVELDDRSEKIGYKIRDAETKKIPFMAVVGEKESEARTVSVRRHKDGDTGAIPLSRFVELVTSEAKAASATQASA